MEELQPIWPDAPRREPGLRFPPYRFIPGFHERPKEGHVTWADPFAAGVDLYHQGYLWEAHEAWEAVYREVSGDERERVQGLIQLAAALIKVHVGNEAGVQKLYAKSRARLDGLEPELVAAMDAFFGREPRDWTRAPRVGLISLGDRPS